MATCADIEKGKQPIGPKPPHEKKLLGGGKVGKKTWKKEGWGRVPGKQR